MASSIILKLAFAVLLCIAIAALPAEGGVTCGDVTSKLAPCLGFLESGRGPSPVCCSGVRDLKNMAVNRNDRVTACRCMKSAAAAFPDISPVNTAALPAKCGVSISVVAGAKTDCSNAG